MRANIEHILRKIGNIHPEGLFLIHRTNVKFNILNPMQLNKKYDLITSQFTGHYLNDENGINTAIESINQRHNGSEFHHVYYLPIDELLTDIGEKLGNKTSGNQFRINIDSKLPELLEYKLPDQWRVGYYNVLKKKWVSNRKFNPDHRININPQVINFLREQHAKMVLNKESGEKEGVQIPQPNIGTNDKPVW